MANKKVSELTPYNSVLSGDYIVVDRPAGTGNVQLSAFSSFLFNLPLTASTVANNSITTTKLVNTSVTLDKLNSNVINLNKGLEKEASGIGVKLAAGSGLEFNGSGELKLSPPAATSTVVVVRPSDTGATDVWVNRSAVGGELKPYFKSLISACNWARTNLNGTVTIFVDEDTIEGSVPDNNYGVDETNCLVRYITQTKIDSIFPSKGFKAGLYVWSKDTTKAIGGQIWWSNGISNSTKNSITYIRARYNRGAGVYSDDRYFTEAPRNINYNVYISCDKSLVAPADSASAVSSNFGTDSTKWTNPTGVNNTNLSWFYVRSSVLMENSKMDIRNLNFVHRFNGPDITTIWAETGSMIWFYNVTVSLLGLGHYNYPVLWAVDASEVRLHGMATLASPEPGSTRRYPGYCLAIVGNKPTISTKETATKINTFFTAENQGWIRQMDWTPNKPNDSAIQCSVILDGNFIPNGNSFMNLLYGGRYEGFPVFIQKDVIILPDRFGWDSSTILSWNSTTGNLVPFYHNKSCEVKIYNWHNPLRKFTFNGATDDTNRAAYGFPMFHPTGGDFAHGVGEFKNISNVNANPVDRYTIKNTVNDFEFVTTNYNIGNSLSAKDPGVDNTNPLDYPFPNLAYMPYTKLPAISTFYTFTENGNTYELNYGAGVRN